MAESIRSRANRYRKGDFTKGELLTIIGGFVADQVIDVATYGQLSKLKGKALSKIVFPAGKAAGSIIARGGMAAAAPIVGSAAFGPAVGVGLGYGALQTGPGQTLLDMAAERGRMDRIRAEQYLTDVGQNIQEFRADPRTVFEQAVAGSGATTITGRRKGRSAFNTAVSKGLKAIKKSTSYGKKGVISTPKKAFGFVARTVSKLRRGKKVSNKGASGVVKRALPGITKITIGKR